LETVVEIANPQQSLSIWHMITQATLVVQLVMGMLVLASVVSWALIFQKWKMLRQARRSADEFENSFWSGGDLSKLYTVWGGKEASEEGGMASIFIAGYREYSRLYNKEGIKRSEVTDGVQRAMRVALAQEIEDLEGGLSFLATVGSTSPYVGLFGTVWGIMNSFRTLGVMKQATIASVAPGISEALVATAMGLFAAIPAVIAYNRYSNHVERLVMRYEMFMEEFTSIVSRQTYHKKPGDV
jgi:biopolymer transport protein TolQ